jgi:long-subunit fatty acid transport protein
VGYDIESSQVISNIGNMVSVYKGYGGINKAYFGSAFSPVKNLSIGVNMSYLFGNIVKERATTFPDSAYYINTMIKSTARLSKVNFDFGLMYHIDMKEGRFMQFGLTYNPKQSVDGNSEKIAYSYTWDYTNDLEIVKDTASIETGTNGVVVLPTSMGAGFMIGSSNRWFATADINYQKWSEFRYLGDNPGLKDNLRVSLGGQLRPSAVDMGKYYQRINYRAGFRYERSYLEIRQTRINDFGVSFGVGLPMKKSRSTINIAVELGRQGTTDSDLIQENYMRLTIGTSLQERWFLKKKFY